MRKWPWFALVFIVIMLDLVTKYWAVVALIPYQPEYVMPMMNFTLAFNSGAAFSFLSDTGRWHYWLFSIFSLVMSVFLWVWLVKTPAMRRWQLGAISLILGGAVGNLINRFYFGAVIDFIDVYYQHYHWPDFNIADSAICAGAFMLLIQIIREKDTP